MTGASFSYFVTTLLILIHVVLASIDGSCTINETYLDAEQTIETYKYDVPTTKKCKILGISNPFNTCYGYSEKIGTHMIVKHITKTRKRQQCCEGYLLKESSCIPLCFIKCINGYCSRPNECSCNSGYEPTANKYRCKKKCAEGFIYDESSQKCTCSLGYHSNDEGNCIKNECDPATPRSNECLNGNCTSTGVCLCYDGFVKNESSLICEPFCDEGFEFNMLTSKCLPKCRDGCVNGYCLSPDNCVCNAGYHSNDEGNCTKNECDPATPQSSECLNGICTSAGVCLCDEGFVKNDSSLICEPICDEGFEFNVFTSKCLPKCVDGCVNGNCSSPDNCVCNVGYHSNDEGNCTKNECDPATPRSNECLNGICTSIGVCLCNEDFVKNDSSLICAPFCDEGFEFNVLTSKCIPKCKDGCMNGNCLSPDNCVCNEEFEFNEELKQCIPTCGEECVNADCKYPNVCTCWTGFSLINSTHCEIICENCSHGYCEVANVCLTKSAPDDENCTNCTTTKNDRVHSQSSFKGSSNIWIFVLAVLAIALCAISIFVYRRYIRIISYRCNTNTRYYGDENLYESL